MNLVKKSMPALALLLATAVSFTACKKDDKDDIRKVSYVVRTSSNVKLTNVTYINANMDPVVVSTFPNETEFILPAFDFNTTQNKTIGLSASGQSTNTVDGTLKVSIVVNGDTVKTNEGTGLIPVANTSHSF
ncbi:hypothetical protein [Polluticaenibacter yanchengensis]|uniref:DUF1735 domain-containing protein n=1 Tax=Polluticaenibacter yanchengensis TaxID=3014562 RepID=A0ABT4UI86_9BACT|nr:hypothetical protein [Chitinophagaceae bacterium LY-5]